NLGQFDLADGPLRLVVAVDAEALVLGFDLLFHVAEIVLSNAHRIENLLWGCRTPTASGILTVGRVTSTAHALRLRCRGGVFLAPLCYQHVSPHVAPRQIENLLAERPC